MPTSTNDCKPQFLHFKLRFFLSSSSSSHKCLTSKSFSVLMFFFFILFFVFGYDNDDAVDFSLLGLVGEEEDEKLIVVVEELILDFNFLLEMFGYNLFKKK